MTERLRTLKHIHETAAKDRLEGEPTTTAGKRAQRPQPSGGTRLWQLHSLAASTDGSTSERGLQRVERRADCKDSCPRKRGLKKRPTQKTRSRMQRSTKTHIVSAALRLVIVKLQVVEFRKTSWWSSEGPARGEGRETLQELRKHQFMRSPAQRIDVHACMRGMANPNRWMNSDRCDSLRTCASIPTREEFTTASTRQSQPSTRRERPRHKAAMADLSSCVVQRWTTVQRTPAPSLESELCVIAEAAGEHWTKRRIETGCTSAQAAVFIRSINPEIKGSIQKFSITTRVTTASRALREAVVRILAKLRRRWKASGRVSERREQSARGKQSIQIPSQQRLASQKSNADKEHDDSSSRCSKEVCATRATDSYSDTSQGHPHCLNKATQTRAPSDVHPVS